MSTHAAIGIKNEDGTINAVYLHRDGCVANAGTLLAECFKTREQAAELIALGDLSSLGRSLAETVAYHRDNGGKLNPARKYRNSDAYLRKADRDFGADCVYLYDGGKWMVYGLYGDHDWDEIEVTVGDNENA